MKFFLVGLSMLGMGASAEGGKNFHWEKIPNAKRYHLQIAADAEFRQILYQTTTSTPETLLPTLPAHRYYFRVQALLAGKSTFGPYFQAGILPAETNMASPPPTRGKANQNLNLFSTVSQGTFTEHLAAGQSAGKITSRQTSPFTFGVSGNYQFAPPISGSASSYFSLLSGGLDHATNAAITIPPEIGITGHLNYHLSFSSGTALYTGLECERFSTFNTDEKIVDPSVALKVRNHLLLYGAIGLSQVWRWGRQEQGQLLIFKVSYAEVLTGSTLDKSAVNNQVFFGHKYIFYLSGKLVPKLPKWGVHTFYKIHQLVGPTTLQTTRIGLGISYDL